MHELPRHRQWLIKTQVHDDLKRWKVTVGEDREYANWCHPQPDLSEEEKAFYYKTLASLRPSKLFMPAIPLKESRDARR